MVICQECGYECPRSYFSSNQLRSWGNGTCIDCTSERGESSGYGGGGGGYGGYSDGSYDDGSYDDDTADDTDISDVRHSGANLEGFLWNQGWEVSEDRGDQGVYYRNEEQGATLTIWYQTGKYRTKLDRGRHPSGRNNQMYGPTDAAGRRVISDITEVAKDVRTHTNNRYSDRWT